MIQMLNNKVLISDSFYIFNENILKVFFTRC